MTYEQYEQRANEIDAWARAQYDAGKMTEDAIERAVERMFDKLDDEYMPGRHVPDLHQTRADVDADASDPYPGWTSMQSAMRDNW
jgi:hypothetical protein